ncbi:MAG: TAXI family TRAP transporter solute-binding subunit [Pseudomonadota bacterium]
MSIRLFSRQSAFALGVSIAFLTTPALAKDFISIGGGGTGGTFNTMASGVGSLLTKKMGDVKFTVEGSAGSTENIRRIGSGDLQMGIAFAGDSYLAANGLEAFEQTGAVENLRFVAFLYSAVSQVVTTKDSGINSLSDLAGHSVSVGSAGSGTAKTMGRILDHLKLADGVSQSNVGGSGSSDQLKNGQLDAYHGQWGVPAGAIVDTTSSIDATLLSTYDELEAAGFLEAYPFYSKAIIPAGSYSGVDEDVTTIRDAGILVVSADVSDDIVYEAVKNLYSDEGLKHMLAVSNVTREMAADSGLVGASIPLHPGAEKFWKEMGADLP